VRIGMLTFRTIDMAAHSQVALRFRDESIRDGGGTLDQDRSDRQYLAWLRRRIAAEPRFAVHAWKDEAIVGEVVLDRYWHDPSAGWVNRYYVVEIERGTGAAVELDAYTEAAFTELGMTRAYLAAFPRNQRAMRFFLRQGWTDLGPPAWQPRVHLLERRYR
jgi:RimJ/RimL family protein N-acetyltransferase